MPQDTSNDSSRLSPQTTIKSTENETFLDPGNIGNIDFNMTTIIPEPIAAMAVISEDDSLVSSSELIPQPASSGTGIPDQPLIPIIPLRKNTGSSPLSMQDIEQANLSPQALITQLLTRQ